MTINVLYNLNVFNKNKQKCEDYIFYGHLRSFFYIIYTFLFGYNTNVSLTWFLLSSQAIVTKSL